MLTDNVHPLVKWVIARAERFLVKRIDLLITVGSVLGEEYKRRGSKRTVVIGNWKRLDEFQFSEAEISRARQEMGIPEDRLIISYVGYFVSSRGLLTLIEAVRSDKNVFLIIGGKGKLEDEISAAVKNTENILYLGYTKPKKVPLITALSDVIYYGIEDSSGNNKYSAPNKLYEALAAGKAILTSSIGEIAKIVREEHCGININKINIENLRNAFKKLRNETLIGKYKNNALLAGINRYNWSNAEKILLDTYDKIW